MADTDMCYGEGQFCFSPLYYQRKGIAMCYGDAGSAVRELKKQGLTQTEATACLDEARDKVATGELEPVEALQLIGLNACFIMALQDAYC